MKTANLFRILTLWLALAVGFPVAAASLTSDRVDGVTASVAVKAPVRVATTANITLSGTQTIDGVAVVAEDRVLVKDQTTASANGIYVAKSTAWERAKDFDGNRDVVTGTIVMVTAGTANANTYWRVSASNPITIGTSSLTFAAGLTSDASALTFLQTGTGAVSRSLQTFLRNLPMNVMDFGCTGDGTTSDQTCLTTAYAAASVLRKALWLPVGTYRFTSQLAWSGSVDIIGESSEFTVLKKDGDFGGIVIDGAAQQSRYTNFTLTGSNDPSTSSFGIKIISGSHGTFERVQVFSQGGDGWQIDDTGIGSTTVMQLNNIASINNGRDGIRVVEGYHIYFNNVDLRGNAGYGINGILLNFSKGNVTVQQNTTGGFYLDTGINNEISVYGEANTGTDIQLTANTLHNLIIVQHVDSAAEVIDAGTDNFMIDISGGPGIYAPVVGRLVQRTNSTGLSIQISGGSGGAGASGVAGGAVNINGGDGAGSTNAAGAAINIQGGTPANTQVYGPVRLQTAGGGVIIGGLSTDYPTNDTVAFEYRGTTKAFIAPRLTSTQRDALTAVNGMYLYNTTTDKLQVRAAGAWVDLH